MTEKAVLVTGSSRGIGKAIALKLGNEGYAVGVNFKENIEKAKEVVNQITEAGGTALLFQADIGVEDEVNQMVESFVSDFDEVFALVNNAGIYDRKKFHNLTLEDWQKTMNINLTGTFLCTKAALPHISNGGRIVNFASVLAHMGSSQGAHYAASKAGVIGFSKSLARELGPQNITVNVVAPGATETAIIADDTPEKRKDRERITPLGRVAQPAEMAEVVSYLLSDSAKYITGETINVNGGMWMV
jgi:3-oxoacyl-[acyl-carrier protein] reductase